MSRPKLDVSRHLVQKTITIKAQDVELFTRLGDGNLSEGMRYAANLLREQAVKEGFIKEVDDSPDSSIFE